MNRLRSDTIRPEGRLACLRARLCDGGLSLQPLWLLAMVLFAPATWGQSLSFGSQTVGSTSGEKNVPVTARSAGTVSNVQFLTLGVSGLDFAPGIGAMTCASASLSLGDACSESVTFTPATPGQRLGAVVLLDSGNNVIGTTYLSGVGIGGLGILQHGNVTTVAGSGNFSGPLGDGSAATGASLDQPSSVALDGALNLYVADRYHNGLRRVDPSTGLISTIAGNGNAAYTGDGSIASSPGVSLNTPWGVAVDGAGNIYIADTGNNVVREIMAASGTIVTVAGNGNQGSSGDGFAATSATLNQPHGVSVDLAGNLYIADTYNHRIRKVDASGIITTIAGDGTAAYRGDGGPAFAAEVNHPASIAFDPAGNIFIADSGNNVVRKIDTAGIISTFAGTGAQGYSGDKAAATAATLFSPSGLACDPAGNVYIADTHNAAIRKVNASSGFISTVARNGVGASVDSGGGPFVVSIDAPLGMVMNGSGNLYFADSLNMKVRKIQGNLAILDYTGHAVRQGSQSAAQDQTIENDGTAPLNLSAFTTDDNAAIDSAATTCSAGSASLIVNADCSVGAIFSPSTFGSPLEGNIGIASATVNAPLVIELMGDATAVSSTSTTFTSSPNPSGFGTPVVLTAAVTTGAGTGSLTGTVSFFDGSAVLAGNVPVGATGTSGTESSATATFSSSSLTVGSHTITAVYDTVDDPTHSSSTSQALTQIVLEGTRTNLVSSGNPSAVGQSATFTANVAPTGGGTVAPDGTVTFTDGSATLCVVTLRMNGVATCAASSLANGPHSIIATYDGDLPNAISGSVSNLLIQDVLVSSAVTVTSVPNPSSFGEGVIFTVGVAPGGTAIPAGTVSLLDNAKQIGTAALTGTPAAATLKTSSLTAGAHHITASYMGDANNAPATSPAIIQRVDPIGTSTTLTAPPNPVNQGSLITLDTAVRAANGTVVPSGSVFFVDTFNTKSANLGSVALGTSATAPFHPVLGAGSHSIVAEYSGDTNNQGSESSPLTLVVQPGDASISLKSSLDPSVVESAVTFIVSVASEGGQSAGTVRFFSGTTAIGSAAVDAKGTARLTTSALTVGTHVITAEFAGAASQPVMSFAVNQVVEKISTITEVATSSTSSATSNNLLATVTGKSGATPTGSVNFTNGTQTLGSAALNAAGLATFTPSLAAGTYSIVAVYGGDSLHSPSTSHAVSISSGADSFSISVTPPSVTMARARNATVPVTLASFNYFSDTITLGCSELPAGVTCDFSSSRVALAANSRQSAQLTITNGTPLSSRASAVNNPAHGNASAGAAVFPSAILYGCLLCLFRRRGVALPISTLLLFAAVMLMSSCSTISRASARPGSYVIQIIGTGVRSNLSRFQNVALDITN